jgi:hypothetical protein
MQLITQELRNCIDNYTYTTEIEDARTITAYGIVPASHLARGQLQPEWSSIWKRREFIGLTQVCRQIRSEYLPICKKCTKVQPNLYKVYDYIDRWVMPGDTSEDEVLGNVILEFVDAGLGRNTGGLQTVKTLDTWPLIILDRLFPGFRMYIQDPIQRPTYFGVMRRDCLRRTTILALSCDAKDIEALHNYMYASIANLEMASGDNIVPFTFVMGIACWEDCMVTWTLAVECVETYEGVEPYSSIRLEMHDVLKSWERNCGMDIRKQRIFTFRLDYSIEDEPYQWPWLITCIHECKTRVYSLVTNISLYDTGSPPGVQP